MPWDSGRFTTSHLEIEAKEIIQRYLYGVQDLTHEALIDYVSVAYPTMNNLELVEHVNDLIKRHDGNKIIIEAIKALKGTK